MPPALATHNASAAEFSEAANNPSMRSLLPRRALTWAGYAVFAMAAAFVCSGTVVPALLGYHSTAVYGGSMGPSLPTGSIAVTETVGSEEVQLGDIIAFAHRGDKATVMHRVVAIEERDAQPLVTLRGDMNGADDPEPLLLNGDGDRLVYYVPFLGYLLHYARTTAVLVPTLLAIASIVAFEWMRARRRVATQVLS